MVEECGGRVDLCGYLRGWGLEGDAVKSIDVHFHIVPPRFVDLLRRQVLREIVDVVQAADENRLLFRPPPGVIVEPDTSIRPHLHDARLILDAMDRRKLDAAALSPAPECSLYWAPPELGESIARTIDNGMAELARAYPDRFLPLAALPMQDPVRATRELERAVTVLGLGGAALCTHVNGADHPERSVACQRISEGYREILRSASRSSG